MMMPAPPLLPPAEHIIENDEGTRRTRRIHAVFKIVVVGVMVYWINGWAFQHRIKWNDVFVELPIVLLCAVAIAAFIAFTGTVRGRVTVGVLRDPP